MTSGKTTTNQDTKKKKDILYTCAVSWKQTLTGCSSKVILIQDHRQTTTLWSGQVCLIALPIIELNFALLRTVDRIQLAERFIFVHTLLHSHTPLTEQYHKNATVDTR